jgi:hypothetical protein
MAFTTRPDSDPTNIGEWLAGRGVGQGERQISPQEPRPEKLLEADNSGIGEWIAGTLKLAGIEPPRDYRFCPGCGRKLPMLKIRNRGRHCSPACRKRAFRKRHGLPSYEGPTHGRRRGQPVSRKLDRPVLLDTPPDGGAPASGLDGQSSLSAHRGGAAFFRGFSNKSRRNLSSWKNQVGMSKEEEAQTSW